MTHNCTEACEAMPDCAVCGKRKAPIGRSVAPETYWGLLRQLGLSRLPRGPEAWAPVAGGAESLKGGRVKTQGLHPYRFTDNPEEKRFAEAWAAENGPARRTSLLSHLLGDGVRQATPSMRDERVAATVIQWLGSPVGQSWLRELGYERRTP